MTSHILQPPSWTASSNSSDLYLNDESIININKYRFHDFYYEELDKLNKKYYLEPDTGLNGNHPLIEQSIEEETSEANKSQKILTTQQISSQPINIFADSSSSFSHNKPVKINRYRLNSLNNFINSPTSTLNKDHPPEFNMSMSPPGSNNIGTASTTNSQNSIIITPSSISNTNNLELPKILSRNIELHTPAPNHKIIVKRVYDNYLSINIDNLLALLNIPQPNNSKPPINNIYTINLLQDFISDELNFLCDLMEQPFSIGSNLVSVLDPFDLINPSTIGLLFDRMNKSRFSLRLAHVELLLIINELSNRNRDTVSKSVIKQSLLDTAIGILQHTVIDLLQPGQAIDQVLIVSLSEFIKWIYSNYASNYWMPPLIINISFNLATDLSARFGSKMVAEIFRTIRLHFIPSHLFSVSRTAWKFTNIHRREINKLRSIIIPPSSETCWIIKCLEQSRKIPWVHPNTPHLKNLIVFIDGRNWFYSDEYIKTTGGINLDLLRQFLTLGEYHQILSDLVFGRITELMAAGRQLINKDPWFVIPVLVFNEKYRNQIQPYTENNGTIIYTPRGRNDDLMTLYLWLSNPGSFIASNDTFGDHAARISKLTSQSKYFEGLWSELTRCFKLLNPFINHKNRIPTNTPIHYNNKLSGQNNNRNEYYIQPGTSAPF